jgi:hypothetical protein
MDGRAFLYIARDLLRGTTPAHWRSAANRAYYALMLEGREALRRWGFVIPKSDRVHPFVRLRFTYSPDAGLKAVGVSLDYMVYLRGHADYDLMSNRFDTDQEAWDSFNRATAGIPVLDAIQADPVRRAAVIADIRARWPCQLNSASSSPAPWR